MEAEKLAEMLERVKNAEHCVITTIDKNGECFIYLDSGNLEMKFMLKEIIKDLTHDDKQWLLQIILLELSKKGETENEQ